jgi:amino acid transporter
MARLFCILAVLDLLALLVTIAFGAASKFWDHELYLSHFTLGLFTAIGTLLVHCLIFTYFLGTGRWVKEVGLAYQLPDGDLPRKTRELKRTTFPPALLAMLLTIATAAAGAGAQLRQWPWYVHGSLALLTLAINVWAFRIELRHLAENVRVLDAVMAEVERLRAAAGLSPNAEALAEQLGAEKR